MCAARSCKSGSSRATPSSGDDMERHDKWLSMMWPRINLLRELLGEDGVFFVSVDNNEVHHVRCLMDEIFKEKDYVVIFNGKRNLHLLTSKGRM